MEKSDNVQETPLKLKTARTLKWNTIDRLASQVLYGVVGVVLANVLPQEDFGLVGALLVFQAFAIIFADSGFGAALLQKKNPTQEDYSTVFWFNLIVSIIIYWILWFCAPLIADIFQNDRRLIPLSKVMFLTFVLNAMAIVQTNRLMKHMDVRMLAISNVVAQVGGGGLGIVLALLDYGAWALVWQSVALAGLKTGILWLTGRWRPTCWMKLTSLKTMWRIGLSVFSSSMLNTLFLNLYSFVIGHFYSLRALANYTQADKWSKMGTASLSQVLTASFVPLLARVQDSPDDFRRYIRKINRFSAFVLFPAMFGLAATGPSLFHTLFGNKWDAAIILFQILAIRGIFVVLISLYGNYMLAKGYGKRLVTIEIVKDLSIAIAIAVTIWDGSVDLLVWGQLWASLLTWVIVLCLTSHAISYGLLRMLRDLIPFLLLSLLMTAATLLIPHLLPTASPTASTNSDSLTASTNSDSLTGDIHVVSVVTSQRTEPSSSSSVSLLQSTDPSASSSVSLLQSTDPSASSSVSLLQSPASSASSSVSLLQSPAPSVSSAVTVVPSIMVLLMQILVGSMIYIGGAWFLKLPELHEAITYILGRFRTSSAGSS